MSAGRVGALSLIFPFTQAPDFGALAPVAQGVWWLRMPLPFALDHVNLWLIEEPDGSLALVDTGVSDQRTRDLWNALFNGPMAGRRLSRLISTHFHPDHIGLAAWLQRRFEVPLETPLAEWLYGRMLSQDTGEAFTEISTAFYRAAGFSEEMLRMVAERGNAYGARVKHIPAQSKTIRDGDELRLGGRLWRVITAQGHSPEMACLFCPDLNLLISGDQILPSISPNVSVWPSQPFENPLKLFLASLERFRDLPQDVLVLPSHGLPFQGLPLRLAALGGHHRDRLAETLTACSNGGITALDLLKRLFRRPLDDHQLFFALGESLAHLHYLEGQDSVRRQQDAAGADRWAAV